MLGIPTNSVPFVFLLSVVVEIDISSPVNAHLQQYAARYSGVKAVSQYQPSEPWVIFRVNSEYVGDRDIANYQYRPATNPKRYD